MRGATVTVVASGAGTASMASMSRANQPPSLLLLQPGERRIDVEQRVRADRLGAGQHPVGVLQHSVGPEPEAPDHRRADPVEDLRDLDAGEPLVGVGVELHSIKIHAEFGEQLARPFLRLGRRRHAGRRLGAGHGTTGRGAPCRVPGIVVIGMHAGDFHRFAPTPPSTTTTVGRWR